MKNTYKKINGSKGPLVEESTSFSTHKGLDSGQKEVPSSFFNKNLRIDRDKFERANNYFQKLKVISDYYVKNEDAIIELGHEYPRRWFRSYPIDWSIVHSPIEQMAWQSIRRKGGIVLYPQYPVLNYFIDFANPTLRIGLELDGAQYHNPEKDFLRDKELDQEGWKIFRISGSEMNNITFKEEYEMYDLERDDIEMEMQNWILNTGDGVIEAIKRFFFTQNYKYFLDIDVYSLCCCSLDRHSTRF